MVIDGCYPFKGGHLTLLYITNYLVALNFALFILLPLRNGTSPGLGKHVKVILGLTGSQGAQGASHTVRTHICEATVF